jgi:hypothetical protein
MGRMRKRNKEHGAWKSESGNEEHGTKSMDLSRYMTDKKKAQSKGLDRAFYYLTTTTYECQTTLR